MGLSQLAEPEFAEIYYDNKGGDYKHVKPTKYISKIQPKEKTYYRTASLQKFKNGDEGYIPHTYQEYQEM